MYLSSDQIPSPLEHVTRGSDVFLTTVDPLSDARDRLGDLQFAMEFNQWRVVNYLQFQEAVDLEGRVFDMLQCLVHLKGTELGSAAEREALRNLYDASLKLEELYIRSEDHRHSLTTKSPRLRTVGAPLRESSFEVQVAAPHARPLIVDKLITEFEAARASPFPLEFRRFSGWMMVSSLRDTRHVLAATTPHHGKPRTWKVLITGATPKDAPEMLKLMEEHWEVAGWDVSRPVSTWQQYGWEIGTDATFQKLRFVSKIDGFLSNLYTVIARAAHESQASASFVYLVTYWCEETAGRLNEAHAQFVDFQVLDLANVARQIIDFGTLFRGGWNGEHDMLGWHVSECLDYIASVRARQVRFSLD